MSARLSYRQVTKRRKKNRILTVSGCGMLSAMPFISHVCGASRPGWLPTRMMPRTPRNIFTCAPKKHSSTEPALFLQGSIAAEG